MGKKQLETCQVPPQEKNEVKDARKMPGPMRNSNFKRLTTFPMKFISKGGGKKLPDLS